MHQRVSGTGRPEYPIGPAATVPMTEPEREEAVHALAVLIAAWWTDHPPDADEAQSEGNT